MYKICDSRIPWVQRKEISAWSAILFLYGILWSSTSFIYNDNSFIDPASVQNIVLVLILIYIICFVFFRFVHSQYASIYYITAYTNVVRSIIFDLSKNENSFLESNKIANFKDLKNIIEKEVDSELSNEVQKFREKCHPMKVVFYLWIPIVYRIFHQNKIILSAYEKAEASIYSLILICLTFYTITLIKCLTY